MGGHTQILYVVATSGTKAAIYHSWWQAGGHLFHLRSSKFVMEMFILAKYPHFTCRSRIAPPIWVVLFLLLFGSWFDSLSPILGCLVGYCSNQSASIQLVVQINQPQVDSLSPIYHHHQLFVGNLPSNQNQVKECNQDWFVNFAHWRLLSNSDFWTCRCFCLDELPFLLISLPRFFQVLAQEWQVSFTRMRLNLGWRVVIACINSCVQ